MCLLLPAFGPTQSISIDPWLFSDFCTEWPLGLLFPCTWLKRLTATLSRAQGPTRRANFNNNCELFSLLKGKVEVMEDIATVIIWYHIYWFFSPLNHCLGLDVKLVFTLLALIAAFGAPIPYLTFLQFSTCSVSVLSSRHLVWDTCILICLNWGASGCPPCLAF